MQPSSISSLNNNNNNQLQQQQQQSKPSIKIRPTPMAAQWSNGRKLLLIMFCFAYTIACIGIFFLRPTISLQQDKATLNKNWGEVLLEQSNQLEREITHQKEPKGEHLVAHKPVERKNPRIMGPKGLFNRENFDLFKEDNKPKVNEMDNAKDERAIIDEVVVQEPHNVEENQRESNEVKIEKPQSALGLKKDGETAYHVKTQDGQLCLGAGYDFSIHSCPLPALIECDPKEIRMAWKFKKEQLLVYGNCLDIFTDESNFHVCDCHGNLNQHWIITPEGQIRSNFGEKKCLRLNLDGKGVYLGQCEEGEGDWIFEEIENLWGKGDGEITYYGFPVSKYKGIPDEGIMVNGKISYADTKAMERVKSMMKLAWDGYVKYAWGTDELKPVSKTSRNWIGNGIAASVLDSLDTLHIMGLTSEFQQARDYVADHLNFNQAVDVSFFETTIRGLGGLLAAYGLSKDQVFLDKAIDLGDRLLYAFNSHTGLPYGLVNLKSHNGMNQRWSPGSHILAEIGTVQLEFKYLSEVSGDPKYAEKSNKVMEIMKNDDKRDSGLYSCFIDQNSGSGNGAQDYSVGGLGDSYYEYLLKQWLQTNKTESRLKKWYYKSEKGIKRLLLNEVATRDGQIYKIFSSYKNGYKDPRMEHLACFAAGMFTLGSMTGAVEGDDVEEDLIIGADVTTTCRTSYAHQASGLGPEKFGFSQRIVGDGGRFYILRPEYVESLFYMWRATHDQRYRKWAWEALDALDHSCRTEVGFSGIDDVGQYPPPKNDVQERYSSIFFFSKKQSQ